MDSNIAQGASTLLCKLQTLLQQRAAKTGAQYIVNLARSVEWVIYGCKRAAEN